MLFRPPLLTQLTNFGTAASETRNPNKQNHFNALALNQFRPFHRPSFYRRPKVTSLTQPASFQQLPKVTTPLHPVPPYPGLPVLSPFSFRNLHILKAFSALECPPESDADFRNSRPQSCGHARINTPLPRPKVERPPTSFFESQLLQKNYLLSFQSLEANFP